MASDGDTISLNSKEKTKPQRPLEQSSATPEPPTRPALPSAPKRHHTPLEFALIGIGFGLAVGLTVGILGLMLLR